VSDVHNSHCKKTAVSPFINYRFCKFVERINEHTGQPGYGLETHRVLVCNISKNVSKSRLLLESKGLTHLSHLNWEILVLHCKVLLTCLEHSTDFLNWSVSTGIFSKIQQQMEANHTAMAKKSLWVLYIVFVILLHGLWRYRCEV